MQHRSATTTPTLVIIFTLLFSFLAPFNYLAWSRDVTLGWDPNPESDLLGYNVYVGEAIGSYGPAMSAENNTTYTIQGLDDKKTYYFVVTAYNTSGTEGGPSNEIMLLAVEDTTPPTTPGDLKASVLSSTQITLTWDPATDDVGVTNYKISRDGILIKTQSGTQYTNSNLAPDTLYTYRVTAVDEADNASKPAETSATTDAAPAPGTGFLQNQEAGGLLSIEVEHYYGNTAQGSHSWNFVTPANHSGDGAMEATPNDATNHDTGYTTDSPRMDFQVNFAHTGIHYVWVRGLAGTSGDDSVHIGLDGQAVPTSDRIDGFDQSWGWSQSTRDNAVATIDIPSTGNHTLNVWMREDGFVMDKLVLTTHDQYLPTGVGPVESPMGDENPPADTTPPSTPGNLSATPVSSTQMNLIWDASSDNVGVTAYEISRNTVLIATTGTTNYSDSGLTPSTSYNYSVTAVDEADNASKPAETSATTDAAPDTTPPSVDLTAPSDRSAVSGMVIVSASASDNVEVMGVQFQVNAENLGPEDTTNDYSTNWDTSELEPGSYILTAIARDAAGNTTISTAVTVTIEVTTSNSLLSVSIGGSGTGTVASSPGGLVCSSGTCSSAFVTGSTVTLVAQPAKRWKFAGWSGACSGKMECVLQLLTNESVMATFSKKGGGGGKKGGPKK